MNVVSRRRRLFWKQILLVTVLTCLGAAQTPPAIQNLASKGTLDGMRWADFRDYQPWLQKFYEPTGYSSAWVQGTRPSSQALSMIALFKNAWTKGLEPEDYDASRWDARLRALQASGAGVAGFDVALTVCAMRYMSDLRAGGASIHAISISA